MTRLVPLGAILLLATTAAAQEPSRTRVPCDGRIVSAIVIRAQGPSFGGVFARSNLLSAVVSGAHVTTTPDVVRRFVLLEEGKPCSNTLRADSERILRGQPFLAGASVTAYDDGRGGARVEVVTIDEISIVASLRVSQSTPYVTGVRSGSSNVNGLGIYAAGLWRDGGPYRDGWGISATDYQFLGRPLQLALAATRRRLGSVWATELRHPFYTDLQRIAWRGAIGATNDYFTFTQPDVENPSVPTRRSFADVGLVLRVGEPGRLSLFGASFSRETANPSEQVVVVSDTGLVAVDIPLLVDRYATRRTARVNALWGVRNVQFVRVEGFDALTGEQDVRTGFQFGTILGRSISVLGTTDDDIFVAADMYAGRGTPRSFAALQILAEGRQNYDENRWDDILSSGRAAWYGRFHDKHTTMLSGEWSAGWRLRTPFQLSLGDRDGGMRGYKASELPGSQRAILRAEHRYVFGNVRGNADAGAAVLAEAGRMWAGDAPFGESTPVVFSAGVSLLAAIPPGSQRLWRMDIVMPFTRRGGAGLEFRFRGEDRTQVFWREPGDMERSRERSLPQRIFDWP